MSRGYVLTNQHVIEGATQIQVVLNDDRDASAKSFGIDPDNDIAVLKIDLKDLIPITHGARRIACGRCGLSDW